jgi:hypothetical protein
VLIGTPSVTLPLHRRLYLIRTDEAADAARRAVARIKPLGWPLQKTE